jgi:hypothetical protein
LIEVSLPDLPRPAYQDLLTAPEQEFSYSFGGCTTIRGLEGNYLSRGGAIMRDRINVVYTDTPFSFEEQLPAIERYAEEIRDAALCALEEEAVLIAVLRIHHAE